MYIGLDIGGTKIAAALADKKGKLIKQLTVKTIKSNKKQLQIQQIIDLIQELAGNKKINKIGIAIPGQADQNGKIFNMPNIPSLKGINLVKEIAKKIKTPINIENDANAAALAELYFGAGKNLTNFIYITISTGIGGGIIINKKLYSGHTKSAGEIGHMIIIPNGPLCGCGNNGCWETVGSGTALANMAKAKILNKEKTKILDLAKNNINNINGEVIFEAAKQKDKIAQELIGANAYYNALGITNLVNILDPEAIIIGGGLSFNGISFFKPLKEILKLFKMLNPKNNIKILKAGCKKDSGVLGALAIALEK